MYSTILCMYLFFCKNFVKATFLISRKYYSLRENFSFALCNYWLFQQKYREISLCDYVNLFHEIFLKYEQIHAYSTLRCENVQVRITFLIVTLFTSNCKCCIFNFSDSTEEEKRRPYQVEFVKWCLVALANFQFMPCQQNWLWIILWYYFSLVLLRPHTLLAL